MKSLRILTSAIFVAGLLLTHSTGFAAEKSKPKYQSTKTTYSKSKRRQVPVTQSKEFKVNGIMAWSAAKTNGFLFYPSRATGSRSGQDTWGRSFYVYKQRLKRVTNGAHIVGGVNMLVYNKAKSGGTPTSPREIYSRFHLFSGKTLKSGWKIKEMVITGSYNWVSGKKFKRNTNQIESTIRVVKPKHYNKAAKVMLKEIVLIGPKNGRWQDAFDVN